MSDVGNDKLSKIMEQVNEYSCFKGLSISKKVDRNDRKMHDLFLIGLMYSRSAYLLELSTADTTGFFDIPGISELIKAIDKESTYPYAYLKPTSVQLLTGIIRQIHEDPKYFASLVCNFFKNDQTFSIVFAYLTFPAIFGYFTTEDFCAMASKFLIQYFEESNDAYLSTELMKSFFKALPVFYDHFFYELSKELKDNENYFEVTQNALRRSIYHLSKWHIEAVMCFMRRYKDQMVSFFFNSILLQPFLAAASACPYFSDREKCKKYAEYLNSLLYSDYSNECVMIMEAFLYPIESSNHGMFGIVGWKGPVPLLLCTNDVNVLIDIIKFKEKQTKFFLPNIIPQIPNSFNPFTISIFPPSNALEFSHFSEDLFGKRSEIKEIPNYEEYERYWHSLKSKAKDENRDICDVFEQLKVTNNSIKYYIYTKIALKYKNNCKLLEKSIVQEEYCKKIIDITHYIKCRMLHMFHLKTLPLFEKMNSSIKMIGKDILERIKSISNMTQNLDENIFFELVLAALDCSQISISPYGCKIGQKFMFSLEEFVMKYECNKNIELSIAIAENANAFSKNSNWSFGKMIRQMLQFENQLQQICNMQWSEKPDRNYIFAYALMAIVPKTIFPLFLFAKCFVFDYMELTSRCPSAVLESWYNFSTGMWAIISADNDLLNISHSEDQLMKMFAMKNEDHKPKSK